MATKQKSTADDFPAHFDQDTPVQRAANAATARVVRGRADEAAPAAKKATVTRLDGKKMRRGKDGLIHGDRVKLPKGKRAPKLGAAKPGEPLVTGETKK
jgi:hypothetical protein